MLFTWKSKSILLQLLLFDATVIQSLSSKPTKPEFVTLPTLREQAVIQDAWTEQRKANIPNILNKYGVDAWLMTQREYAEDTVFWSLKSAKQFSARRRTLQLFLANPKPGTPYSYSWIDNTPTVYTELLAILTTQNPSTIALNISPDISFSSGLHVGELTSLSTHLGPQWASKFVSVPMIAVEFVASKVPGQLEWYRKLQSTAWAMIEEAFSEKVITPGVTTTDDVEWHLRSKLLALNYTTWFHPDVTILTSLSPTPSTPNPHPQKPSPHPRKTIQHHDLLHVDFGVSALGLNTDTQHLAYVLPPSTTSIPSSLHHGLATTNRLQDIVRSNMLPGLSGNAILSNSLAEMRAEGINGKIYCHPIGDWGHSAGTLIGMTNLQEGVPVLGDLELLGEGYYSVELYAKSWVEEVGEVVNFYLEEDVWFDAETGTWEWVWGRQEEFWVVRSVGEEGWQEEL
ncbi:hypothetical protein V8E51_010711 [Hyaloscypha variabilis]